MYRSTEIRHGKFIEILMQKILFNIIPSRLELVGSLIFSWRLAIWHLTQPLKDCGNTCIWDRRKFKTIYVKGNSVSNICRLMHTTALCLVSYCATSCESAIFFTDIICSALNSVEQLNSVKDAPLRSTPGWGGDKNHRMLLVSGWLSLVLFESSILKFLLF